MIQKKLAQHVLCVIGLLCVALASPAAAASKRIIAVGDLHGDYAAFDAILNAAGLTDAKGQWKAKDTVLVQTGDVVDRGPDGVRIIRRLQQLRQQAPHYRSKVVALIGNHEAMNMLGDFRYVDDSVYAAFADGSSSRARDERWLEEKRSFSEWVRRAKPNATDDDVRAEFDKMTPLGWVEHRAAWKQGGELGNWVLGNDALALIGGTLFVHGGVSPAYAKYDPAVMNSAIRDALISGSRDPKSIANDPLGPLWYRGLARADDEAIEMDGSKLTLSNEFDALARRYRIKRVVIGHTPNRQGIRKGLGGKILDIDTGISSAFGGSRSFLEIRGGRVYAHDGAAVSEIK